jgi:hypothetical protein
MALSYRVNSDGTMTLQGFNDRVADMVKVANDALMGGSYDYGTHMFLVFKRAPMAQGE